jgi:predicted Zn-dependent peptidase
MKVQETVREDGLHIITGKVPSKKVHMRLIAKVGSAYDPEDKKGLYHDFEHMAFKGTGSRSAHDISDFLLRNVLSNNASTSRLYTSYYGEAVRRKFTLLNDLLCDIYLNSVYPVDEIEKEKEVVLNEIARDHDEDSNIAFFALWERLWKHNPLREFGVGLPEGVKSITRGDLLIARDEWYQPSNTIAVAVGAVDHNEFVSELNKNIPLRDRRVHTYKTWADEYNDLPDDREVVIERPGREKAIVMYGCKFPLYSNDKEFVLRHALIRLLVSGTSSLLWKAIREDRGLAYSVTGGTVSQHPLGSYFYAYAETLPDRVDEVRELMVKYLHKTFTDQQAFDATREYLIDWFSLRCEEIEDWADLILRYVQMEQSTKLVERYFSRQDKNIQSITLDEVEELRASVLKPERFVTVIVKPC